MREPGAFLGALGETGEGCVTLGEGTCDKIEESKRSQRTRVGKWRKGEGSQEGDGERGESRRLRRVLEGSGLGVQGLLS